MLIIDGDLYVYKAGFAHRAKEIGFKIQSRNDADEVDLGNISLTEARIYCRENNYEFDQWKLTHYNNPIPLEYTLGNLNTMIESLMKRFNYPTFKMFITASDYSNYRFNISTIQPYKGTRNKCVKCFERCSSRFGFNRCIIYSCKYCGDIEKECTFSDRPHYYNEIRDHLIKRWNAELISNQEADDAISIEACELMKKGYKPIMVHIDKDINNTPGEHYNPDKDKLYTIDYHQSLKNFYTQFLIGDNIDCIPGVLGAGKIIAEELFKDCSEKEQYEKIIFDLYQGINKPIKRFKNKMKLTPQEAYDRLTEIGQLLHIRQEENELWKPTITGV